MRQSSLGQHPAFRSRRGLSVGARNVMASLHRTEGLRKRPRDRIGKGGIGHHPLDANAVAGMEGGRVQQEARRRRSGLVGVNLNVGQAEAVVDGDVEEVITVTTFFATAAGIAFAEEPMPTASWNSAEPFGVHMQQLAGPLPNVAKGTQ